MLILWSVRTEFLCIPMHIGGRVVLVTFSKSANNYKVAFYQKRGSVDTAASGTDCRQKCVCVAMAWCDGCGSLVAESVHVHPSQWRGVEELVDFQHYERLFTPHPPTRGQNKGKKPCTTFVNV